MNEAKKHYFLIKGQTAEKVVQDLADKTFITDWCYPNPKLPDGKELCDLLVVFDTVAIIWQVKDLKLDENGRYKKSEVEKNIRQLLGARRQLFDLKKPIALENPRRGKELFDPSTIKEIYLISVLLGEGEEFYRTYEEIKNHPVHIFNKSFTEAILGELDTASDFCEYLRKKEALMAKDRKLFMSGGEEELLAFYLMNAREFEEMQKANVAFLDGTLWEHMQTLPEYKGKKVADEISYLWDSIIDRAHEVGKPEYEIIARELARLNRFERRCLSKAFYEAQLKAQEDEKHPLFRRFVAGKGATYCFLFMDENEPRSKRIKGLEIMCFAGRGQFPDNMKVIGIATEKAIRPECSYDFIFLDKPEWTEDDERKLKEIKEKLGILRNPVFAERNEEEFPSLDNS
jgi:hypothetical protein